MNINDKLESIHFKYECLTSLVGLLQMTAAGHGRNSERHLQNRQMRTFG